MTDERENLVDNLLSKQILRSRARLLARPLVMEQDRQIVFELVEFKACGRRLAVETKFVDEAITIKDISLVPQTSPLVSGITNVRGQIVTVVDLSVLFDINQSAADANLRKQSNKAAKSASDGLILRFGALRLAVCVDEVLGVRQLDSGELSQGFTGLSDRLSQFTVALTTDLLIILDAKRIFTDGMIGQLAG
ncbi:chemotaxis protein CheW [bacterium]|nr:chemotaxis protein CheW [bacterium]MBP9094824.1 chemotaxis protein CheW [bacterium]